MDVVTLAVCLVTLVVSGVTYNSVRQLTKLRPNGNRPAPPPAKEEEKEKEETEFLPLPISNADPAVKSWRTASGYQPLEPLGNNWGSRQD